LANRDFEQQFPLYTSQVHSFNANFFWGRGKIKGTLKELRIKTSTEWRIRRKICLIPHSIKILSKAGELFFFPERSEVLAILSQCNLLLQLFFEKKSWATIIVIYQTVFKVVFRTWGNPIMELNSFWFCYFSFSTEQELHFYI